VTCVISAQRRRAGSGAFGPQMGHGVQSFVVMLRLPEPMLARSCDGRDRSSSSARRLAYLVDRLLLKS
jgi:hypothetical protein